MSSTKKDKEKKDKKEKKEKSPKEKDNVKEDVESEKKEAKKEKKSAKEKESTMNIKKEELISEYKALHLKLEKEKKDTEIVFGLKQAELEKKEKIFTSISNTNNKLIHELGNLNNLILEKEKEDIEKERNKNKNKKGEDPIEVIIKTKEKELEDSITLLEKIRKENNFYKQSLSDTSDYNQVVILENKLTGEENKFQQLTKELKTIEKFCEERKKALENAKLLKDLEKKKYESEIKGLKGSLKQLTKQKVLEEKEYEKKIDVMHGLKRSILAYEDKNGMRSLEENLIKQKEQQQQIKAKYSKKQETIKKKYEDFEKENRVDTNPYMDDDLSIFQRNKTLSKEKKKSESHEKKNIEEKPDNVVPIKNNKISGLNNNNLNFKSSILISSSYGGENDPLKNIPKLFDEADYAELEKILPKKTIELYESRYNTIHKSKIVEEKKYKTSMKQLKKKIQDVEERIEMNTILIKEAENKSVILSHQIEEIKEENRKITEKLQSAIHVMNDAKKRISDKEIENKSYLNEIQEMKAEFQKELDVIMNPPKEEEEKNEEEEKENENEEDEIGNQDDSNEDE